MLEKDKKENIDVESTPLSKVLEDIRVRLKDERKKRNEFSRKVIADDTEVAYKVTYTDKEIDLINTALCELKKNEPTSDNVFFRLAIINYELGDLNRAIVYAHRFRNSDKALFKDGFKSEEVILSEGKLAMADLLTQLNMLCITMNWNFNELRRLGVEHLDERQKDFQRDRWSEVK